METTGVALPVTPRQLAYAKSLALRNKTLLPWETQRDRGSLSAWIEAQTKLKPVAGSEPTSKQVAFAERLARVKCRAVPDDCFGTGGCSRAGSTATVEAVSIEF